MEFVDNVQSILDIKRQEMLDESERQLYKLVESGYFPAIKFVLNTTGRDRGYGNNLSIDAEIDGEITIDLGK